MNFNNEFESYCDFDSQNVTQTNLCLFAINKLNIAIVSDTVEGW